MNPKHEEDLRDAVKRAEAATSDIKDKELRKVAFETLLSHLLETRETPAIRGATQPETPRSAKQARPVKKKSGPMVWLEEMVDDGFFKQPRTSKEILDELASRGHNLRLSDITDQLQQLVQNRRLRRKKEASEEGARKVWKYSNW